MADLKKFLKKGKPGLERLDLVQWQGVFRFKSGAYTLVREHFGAEHNAVTGQEMNALSSVLAFAAEPIHGQP